MINTSKYDGIKNLKNQEPLTPHQKLADDVTDIVIDYYYYDGTKSKHTKNKVKDVMSFLHFNLPNEFDELTRLFSVMIRNGNKDDDNNRFDEKLWNISETVAKCLDNK